MFADDMRYNDVMKKDVKKGKNKMKLIDSVKVAAAVGLLMQQTSAFCYPVKADAPAPIVRHQASVNTVDEAMDTINGLREELEKAYWELQRTEEHAAYAVIGLLNPEKVDLCELQLRSLEATIKASYLEADKDQQAEIRPTLIAIAKARAAAANLNGLIAQMIHVPEAYKSDINMEALAALADHGTTAMYH
ncbi:TPA: hypothetical protein ACKE04_003690 [Klebsiella aerogenes]